MATLKIILDKRTSKKDGTYPLRLYVYDGYKTNMIHLGVSLTEKEYKEIFEKTPSGKRLELRKGFEAFLHKAIDLHKSISPFDFQKFKEQLFEKPKEPSKNESLLFNAFDSYIESNKSRLKLKTITGYKTSKNCFERFKPGVLITDVNVLFLESFEAWYNNQHSSTKLNSSASIHLRSLRTVINWLKSEEKLPNTYKYPFGKNRFSIKSIMKPKVTLTQEEILKLVSLDNFNSTEERKARDLWLLQYYCNGVNLNDLIRLRWDNQIGNCFVIQREKTRNTVSTKPVFVRIPIVEGLKKLLNVIGNRNSPYVLGYLREDMTEAQILERKRRVARLMNPHLKEIGRRLNFSVELLSETSRDAYATTLKRNGRSIEEIAEMLGHSTITCTKHYLAQFEDDKLHSINSLLP